MRLLLTLILSLLWAAGASAQQQPPNPGLRVNPWGTYNLTPPTLTAGQFAGFQLDASGNLKIICISGCSGGGGGGGGGSISNFPTTVTVGAGATDASTLRVSLGTGATTGTGLAQDASLQSLLTAEGTANSSLATIATNTGRITAGAPGSDASNGAPTALTTLATFTVANPGAYYVQNQSGAAIQVIFSNAGSGPSTMILAPGAGANAQGGDTSPAMTWFTGQIIVAGASGAQFMARHN